MMKDRRDPSDELPPEAFDGTDIVFTADPADLAEATFYIVAVPTPVDEHKVPNLGPVLSASEMLGTVLKKGDYVVYESTVYPGCTEEDCIPALERESGLTFKDDFKVGYSPERINPGDTEHTIRKIKKVVSGCCDESARVIADVYGIVVDAGTFTASSIKVAEAAKIIENTQRDLNIALMNELSMIFDKIGINTFEVLEAAGTKWNFLNFFPGLVGGHCIGVDPYYLTYKSIALGYKPEIILSGRRVNDGMGGYVARRLVQKLIKSGRQAAQSRVLVMGATFKEDVSDIRNSKVVDVVRELEQFSVNVDVADPHADAAELKHEYDLDLIDAIDGPYDAVIVAVNHAEYAAYSEDDFKAITNDDAFIVDIKGIFRNTIQDLNYWSL